MSILTNGFWLGDLNSFSDILKLEDSIHARMEEALRTNVKFDMYSGYGDDEDEYEDTPESQGYQVVNDIAIIPIKGNLTTQETWYTRFFGMPTYEGVSRMLRHAADSGYKRAVLDIDTPGGSSVGIDELGLLIAKIDSETMPIHGYTSGSANSAGYWIMAACRDITCTKMSNLGSIGVVTIHQEISKMLKERGVEVTVFRDGEFKAKPNMYEKLDDKTKEMVNGSLKLLGNFFLDWVAEQRNFNRDTVRADVGEGRVFFGQEAVVNGLADRIMFFDDFISKLSLLDSIEVDRSNLSHMVSLSSGKQVSVKFSEGLSPQMVNELVLPAIQKSIDSAHVVKLAHNKNSQTEDNDMSVVTAKDKSSKAAGKKIQTAQGEMTLQQAQASVEMGTLELTEELKLAMAEATEPEDSNNGTEANAGGSTDENLEAEGNGAELSTEELANKKEGDPVVAHIQNQLNEQIAANSKQLIELETVKAKLSSQDDTVKALTLIAMNSCQKMNLAMGGAQIDLSSMDTATLLGHHNTLSEQFTTVFKTGGVAAVNTTNEHAEEPAETMSAPLSTVSFKTHK